MIIEKTYPLSKNELSIVRDLAKYRWLDVYGLKDDFRPLTRMNGYAFSRLFVSLEGITRGVEIAVQSFTRQKGDIFRLYIATVDINEVRTSRKVYEPMVVALKELVSNHLLSAFLGVKPSIHLFRDIQVSWEDEKEEKSLVDSGLLIESVTGARVLICQSQEVPEDLMAINGSKEIDSYIEEHGYLAEIE